MSACSGALAADSTPYGSLTTASGNTESPKRCVSLRCQGYEASLAECVIYDKVDIGNQEVATATCYQAPEAANGQLLHSFSSILHCVQSKGPH